MIQTSAIALKQFQLALFANISKISLQRIDGICPACARVKFSGNRFPGFIPGD
jgi:hypothetical protein